MHQNIRHDLDPVLVAQQIDRKLKALHEQSLRAQAQAALTCESYGRAKAENKGLAAWARPPTTPDKMAQVYEGLMETERTHYATVRIIELPGETPAFILVYGDVDDATVQHGTGPFESLQKAEAWFYNGGR